MADVKISALAAAGALDGSEALPVVQSATTKKATVAQIGTFLGGGKGNATTTDPAVGNDNTQGYAAGSTWLNTTTDALWLCVDAATGAAKWQKVSNAFVPGYVSGNWYDLYDETYSASGVSIAAALQLWQFEILEQVTFSQLAIYVGTLGTSTAMCGIYANNPVTSRPTGNVLASLTGLSNTATGPVSGALASNVTFQPGIYWGAGMSGDGTARYSSTMSTSNKLGRQCGDSTLANVANTGIMNITAPATYGTFPDLTSATFSYSNNASARAMRIYGKVA